MMPCCIRIKRYFLQGLLWLYLCGFGFMALSREPGFLDFDNLPDTNFSCVGKVIGGYYADLETNCQMFHVCTIGQLDEPMDIRFLCLNGTVFDQETRVCERIDEVDCSKSEQFYSLNLELYGHSQSSYLEEISETEQPLIIKSTLPTTTTTPRKTTRDPYYTTATALPTTTLGNRLSTGNSHLSADNNHVSSANSPHIASHHFPILNPSATDIRFNPEEINISLHPGAPPDIRTKAVSYYSDKKVTNNENQLVGTTHRNVFDDSRQETLSTGSSTQKNRYNTSPPNERNGYGFPFGQEEPAEYTEPPESFKIRTEFRPSQEYAVPQQNPHSQLYKTSTFRTNYGSSTPKANNYQQQGSATTLRNYFVQSLKPPPPLNHQSHYGEYHTEKNLQRIQPHLPALPSLPPLTFSSPAPFSLQQRNEQKRYTKDLIPPPRIVISASASVSDASGRRLNYSLGTIGAAQIFKPPPSSYDEYKDEDVALDPFYLDVPKVSKSNRRKRSAKRNEEMKADFAHIIKSDEEALNVLKFLFDWYKNEKTNPVRFTTHLSAPLDTEGISSINYGLAPETDSSRFEETDDNDSLDLIFNTSGSFDKETKHSVVGKDAVSISHEEEKKVNNVQEKFTIEHEPDADKLFHLEEDYVNDNYEPLTYKEGDVKEKESSSNNEEMEQYSIPEDYVDDNIEPIYYKDRIYGEKEYHKHTGKALPNQNIVQTAKIVDYDHLKIESRTETTAFLTTDKILPTTIKISNNRSKNTESGRKFNDNLNKQENENVLDKLVEKSHRAKDDYDYLRTIHFQTSTSASYSDNIDNDFIPTITESPTATVSYIEPETQKTIVEVFATFKEHEGTPNNTNYTLTTSTTTTEIPIRRNKTRRGKHKYRDQLTEETLFTRKKSYTSPKSTILNDNSNISIQKKDSTLTRSSEYFDLSENVDVKNNHGVKAQEPYSEILESTTKGLKHDKLSLIPSERNSKPNNVIYNNHISLSSKRPYIEEANFEHKINSNKDKMYEYMHATSFVPTTESIHISDQKQRFENLLSTQLESKTTENYEEFSTETTSTTMWSAEDLNKMIQNIENNTNSVVDTRIYKQLITKGIPESTTPLSEVITTEISTTPIAVNFSRMHLVSISIEENQSLQTKREGTTEVPVTTEVTEISENIHTPNLEIDKKSIENLITNIDMKLEHKKSLHDKQLDVKESRYTQSTESSDTTSDIPEMSTITLETTTNLDKYTQIPTTFDETTTEQTTAEMTSFEQYSTTTNPFTTTEPTTSTTLKPKRGGESRMRGGITNRHRPESYQKPSYRYRFSNGQFTRKPKARKPTIQDEIVDTANTSKEEFTTESFNNHYKKKYVLTDYPLKNSVDPTQAERSTVTTPISHTQSTQRHFFFNCFGKEIDKFYPDIRDCRLFHYCTQGYSKSQLLDLKFVCDLKTYFDDEKLICTKAKPKRCL